MSLISGRPIDQLLAIMARLRDPDHGCPWDLEQNFATIAPYTIEEAYEVADACERGDLLALKDELGDLLLQVVFHARMAKELGAFDFDDVATAISEKMIRRHPHVFDNDGSNDSRDAGPVAWEAIKASERAEKEDASALAGVAVALPALMRAEKLQKRAARTGFDWPDASGPRAKIIEELEEVEAAPQESVEEEIGDLIFAVVNFARHMKIDPEVALKKANYKFETRFRAIETAPNFAALTLDEKEALWTQAKRDQRA